MSTDDLPTKKSVLNALLHSSDDWVKLVTIVLIVVSGSSNWFATKQVGELQRDLTKEEVTKVRQEIAHIFENQKLYLDNLKQTQLNTQLLNEIKTRLEAKESEQHGN